MSEHEKFMREAIALGRAGMVAGQGGPFGCVVVRDGRIIGRGNNRVLIDQDPTAHAEINAIRDACRALGSFQLDECDIYTSCAPCPMCLGAIYWARPRRIYYACRGADAAAAGFDDQFIYAELQRPAGERHIPASELLRDEALPVFRQWIDKADKIAY